MAKLPTVEKMAICLYRDAIDPATERFLNGIKALKWSVHRMEGTANIDIGRSLAAEMALKAGAQKIFWIDSDMVMEPFQLAVLEQTMATMNVGIISALASRRGTDIPACSRYTKDLAYVGEVVEVTTGAGCAALLTDRSVYDAMQARFLQHPCHALNQEFRPWFMKEFIWFDKDGLYIGDISKGPRAPSDQLCWISEDQSFCYRARLAGFPTFVHTGVQIGHRVLEVQWPNPYKPEPRNHASRGFTLPCPARPSQLSEEVPAPPFDSTVSASSRDSEPPLAHPLSPSSEALGPR